MLNAKEARELSKSQFEVVNGLILEEINEKITEAAEAGLFVCYLDYGINLHILEALKDLGYTVELKSCRNEEQTIIEW